MIQVIKRLKLKYAKLNFLITSHIAQIISVRIFNEDQMANFYQYHKKFLSFNSPLVCKIYKSFKSINILIIIKKTHKMFSLLS